MKKVLAGGAFNLIHPGHVFFLKEARKRGDYLVVVVANDRTVRKNKGYLVHSMQNRKKIIESLKFVDKVVIGDKYDIFRTVLKEKPDVIALGFDQKIDIKKLQFVTKENKLKINIVRIRKLEGHSTKKILDKIKKG